MPQRITLILNVFLIVDSSTHDMKWAHDDTAILVLDLLMSTPSYRRQLSTPSFRKHAGGVGLLTSTYDRFIVASACA